MSGRRVAPPSARAARVRSRGRGARRADTSALAAWGAAAPGPRQTVSRVTLSAVLLVSTALVSGGASQPQLTSAHGSAPQTEAKATAPGTPGVVLARPADRSGGHRTPAAAEPVKKADASAQAPAKGTSIPGPAGDSGEQAHLTSQSSGGDAPGPETTAPGTGQPVQGWTTPAPAAGGNGSAPGGGDAQPSTPGAPVQPGPSIPASPSTSQPAVPPSTLPPAPKPPAPVPGTPAPRPPQNTGCIVDVLGLKICLPVLGG